MEIVDVVEDLIGTEIIGLHYGFCMRLTKNQKKPLTAPDQIEEARFKWEERIRQIKHILRRTAKYRNCQLFDILTWCALNRQ